MAVVPGTVGIFSNAIGVVALLLSGHAVPSAAMWICLVVLGVLGGFVGILLFALGLRRGVLDVLVDLWHRRSTFAKVKA